MRTIWMVAVGILLLLIGMTIGYMYRVVVTNPARVVAAQTPKQAAMKICRLVTGHSKEGKAVVVSDTVIEATRPTTSPGYEFHNLWGADECLTFPDSGAPPVYRDWFAPVGGFCFQQFTFPPDNTPRPAGVDDSSGRRGVEQARPRHNCDF